MGLGVAVMSEGMLKHMTESRVRALVGAGMPYHEDKIAPVRMLFDSELYSAIGLIEARLSELKNEARRRKETGQHLTYTKAPS